MEQAVGGARAKRFPLDVPVQYRMLGTTIWREGQARNISSSGILFSADAAFTIHTGIEMAFDLPATVPPAHVVCRGQIVRVVPGGAVDSRPAVAATIVQYGFAAAPPYRLEN